MGFAGEKLHAMTLLPEEFGERNNIKFGTISIKLLPLDVSFTLSWKKISVD